MANVHARIIDVNEYKYSVEVIRKWKKDHENKVKFLQQGLRFNKGVLTKIRISNMARIKGEEIINIENNTLLVGLMATGKSIICELIAGLEEKELLWRWKRSWNTGNTYAEIEMFDGELTKLKINVFDEEIKHFINN